MKNTSAEWVNLIRYRLQCEKDGYPENYLAIVINAMNDECIDPQNPLIFMDNVGHVLTIKYLNTLTIKAINKLFTDYGFADDIKYFLTLAEPMALQYIEDYRINYQQYSVFKTLLSFQAIESISNIDKKRFILTLKRSKNSEGVV
jgi:hypothetical protein